MTRTTASARRAEPIGCSRSKNKGSRTHHKDLTLFVYLSHPRNLPVDINPYNHTRSDHVLCLHASLLQIPAILAFRETVHHRDQLTGGPQQPITKRLRVHAPTPMISTAIRVEAGNLHASLRVVPRLFGMEQEEADSHQGEEAF